MLKFVAGGSTAHMLR